LALVKRIVEMHAGEIRVQSEEGKGTVFELELPLERPPGHPHHGFGWLAQRDTH
jgi:signal transduction histidine kinase